MAISKFGQRVKITVTNEKGGEVYSTDSLRIDFDIREKPGFTRAKFDLYNLNDATVKSLVNGDNYVTLETQLHDGRIHKIASELYVSNALEVPKVPNSITSLFCFSKLRKDHLEKRVDIVVAAPSLRRCVDELVRATKFAGKVVYTHFPGELIDHVPPRPLRHFQASLYTELMSLGDAYGFKVYTKGNTFELVYVPNSRNVVATGLFNYPGFIQLNTRDMRSNPKIGPATLSIESNLNADIQPGTVLDISKLLFIDADVPQDTLEVSEQFLNRSVAGFTKYQTLEVQHKGSNWNKKWVTAAMASSPTPGITMKSGAWHS